MSIGVLGHRYCSQQEKLQCNTYIRYSRYYSCFQYTEVFVGMIGGFSPDFYVGNWGKGAGWLEGQWLVRQEDGGVFIQTCDLCQMDPPLPSCFRAFCFSLNALSNQIAIPCLTNTLTMHRRAKNWFYTSDKRIMVMTAVYLATLPGCLWVRLFSTYRGGATDNDVR